MAQHLRILAALAERTWVQVPVCTMVSKFQRTQSSILSLWAAGSHAFTYMAGKILIINLKNKKREKPKPKNPDKGTELQTFTNIYKNCKQLQTST